MNRRKVKAVRSKLSWRILSARTSGDNNLRSNFHTREAPYLDMFFSSRLLRPLTCQQTPLIPLSRLQWVQANSPLLHSESFLIPIRESGGKTIMRIIISLVLRNENQTIELSSKFTPRRVTEACSQAQDLNAFTSTGSVPR